MKSGGALVPWSVCPSLRSEDRSGAAASAERQEGQAQSGPAEKGSRVKPLVVAPDSSAARALRSRLSSAATQPQSIPVAGGADSVGPHLPKGAWKLWDEYPREIDTFMLP